MRLDIDDANKLRDETIAGKNDKDKDEFVRREQAQENRRFDTITTAHAERIRSVEEASKDFEVRLRAVERFKHIMLGIGILLGILIQPIIRVVMQWGAE